MASSISIRTRNLLAIYQEIDIEHCGKLMLTQKNPCCGKRSRMVGKKIENRWVPSKVLSEVIGSWILAYQYIERDTKPVDLEHSLEKQLEQSWMVSVGG